MQIDVKDLAKIDLGANDILVISSENSFSAEALRRLAENLKKMLPNNHVLILDRGIKIEVIREEDK